MLSETKIKIHDTTAKSRWEIWAEKREDENHIPTHLVATAVLDQTAKQITCSEYCKWNCTVPKNWLQHVQNTKDNTGMRFWPAERKTEDQLHVEYSGRGNNTIWTVHDGGDVSR
jgi:hypothetical protein